MYFTSFIMLSACPPAWVSSFVRSLSWPGTGACGVLLSESSVCRDVFLFTGGWLPGGTIITSDLWLVAQGSCLVRDYVLLLGVSEFPVMQMPRVVSLGLEPEPGVFLVLTLSKLCSSLFLRTEHGLQPWFHGQGSRCNLAPPWRGCTELLFSSRAGAFPQLTADLSSPWQVSILFGGFYFSLISVCSGREWFQSELTRPSSLSRSELLFWWTTHLLSKTNICIQEWAAQARAVSQWVNTQVLESDRSGFASWPCHLLVVQPRKNYITSMFHFPPPTRGMSPGPASWANEIDA